MSLEKSLMTDLKEAMKSKNQAALRAIRAAKAAILLQKTDGSGKVLDSTGEIKLIQKLVKQREDSLSIFEKQGREDLAVIEREEIEVLKKYLPQQLSEEELMPIIKEVIASTGAEGMKDMGKVMGMASAKLAGKADGKTLSGLVKKLLTS
ncbi:MAG: GatB/YqeY domain-containing protein [Saprospiraceae bacterium]|nr:GatB/YqeY domain-containing protein [Bacteroidia bacterium]NNE15462.1 GatB/YqeY domain-containing protein [Saprospiraceae bacterium]NNL92423.1 GatB/YqeY domain-containing protein [Saprospiraceae bacterium]